MNETIINIGADNSELLRKLNQATTSVDKFLTSNDIKELGNLKIDIKEGNFRNTLKEYEKYVISIQDGMKRAWSVLDKKGDMIDLGLKDGIQDALKLEQVLKSLKNARGNGGVFQTNGNMAIANNEVDEYIRKLELAQKAIKNMNKYLVSNKSTGTSLLQGALNVNELSNMRGGVNTNASIDDLKRQIEYTKLIKREYDSMSKSTGFRGFRSEVATAKEELKLLEDALKSAIKERKKLEKQDSRYNTFFEKENLYSSMKQDGSSSFEEQKKQLQEMLNILKKIRETSSNKDTYATGWYNQYKEEMNALDRLMAKKREAQQFESTNNKISSLYEEYNEIDKDDDIENLKERKQLLTKIREEYEKMKRSGNRKLSDSENQNYRSVRLQLQLINEALRRKRKLELESARQAQANARLQQRINDLQNNGALSRPVRNIQDLRDQKRALLEMIRLYERLRSSQGRAFTGNKELEDARRRLRQVNKELSASQNHASRLGTLFFNMFGGFTVGRFLQQMAETTGYFQAQKIAMEGILQDAGVAQKIFSQLKDFSVKSPFEFKDLITQTKQLSAFQVPAEELFDTTKRLADLSAGLGVSMDRLILAFGQVKSASVLRGQEMRQFTEAGIPLVQALADKFTALEGRVVSTGEVFERVSNRMVSFEMVRDVLWDLTDDTGKFYNMQEQLADTVQGKIMNLKDAYNLMLNELGSANLNIINGALGVLKGLLDNAYFSFNLIVGLGIAKMIHSLSKALKWLNTSIAGTRFAIMRMIVSLKKSQGVIAKFKAAIMSLSNIKIGTILGGTALIISGIVGAIRQTRENAKKFKKELDEIGESFDRETRKLVKGFKGVADAVASSLDGTEEQKKAVEKLKTVYGEYIPLLDLEIERIRSLKGEYDSLTQAIQSSQDVRKLEAIRDEGYGKIAKKYFKDKLWVFDSGFKNLFDTFHYSRMIRGVKVTNDFLKDDTNKQFFEDLGLAFSSNIEEGKITREDFAKSLKRILNNYIGLDSVHYSSIETAGNSAINWMLNQLKDDKDLKYVKRKELSIEQANPFKSVINEYIDKANDLKKALVIDGKTSNQVATEKLQSDAEQMGLLFGELTKHIQSYTSNDNIRKNLGEEKYKKFAESANANIAYITELQNLLNEVATNADTSTSTNEDIKALVDKIKAYPSQLNGLEDVMPHFYSSFQQITGYLGNTLGYIEDWQQRANKYVDENASENTNLKSLIFTPKLDFDDKKAREEAGKKLQGFYDNTKQLIEKYQNQFDANPEDNRLKQILDEYKKELKQYEEYAELINWQLEKPEEPKKPKKENYLDIYTKRLNALKDFLTRYYELIETYSHEKAMEILKKDSSDLIAQFANGNAQQVMTDAVTYGAGHGGYDKWDSNKLIGDSKTLQNMIAETVLDEIGKARAKGLDKQAIASLQSIRRAIAKLDFKDQTKALALFNEELKNIVEDRNKAVEFFRSLTALGMKPEDAAKFVGRAGEYIAMSQSQASEEISYMSKMLESRGWKPNEIFKDFDLSDVSGINNAISKIGERLLTMVGEDGSEDDKREATDTIKELLSSLRKLRDVRVQDHRELLEILNKYSTYIKLQASENKYVEERFKMLKAIEQVQKRIIEEKKKENNDEAIAAAQKEYDALTKAFKVMSLKQSKEKSTLKVEEVEDELRIAFGDVFSDLSNLSLDTIKRVRNKAGVLREKLNNEGQLTPDLLRYFDTLESRLLDAENGLTVFSNSLLRAGKVLFSKQDIKDTTTNLHNQLIKLIDDYNKADYNGNIKTLKQNGFAEDSDEVDAVKKSKTTAESNISAAGNALLTYLNEHYVQTKDMTNAIEILVNAALYGNIPQESVTSAQSTLKSGIDKGSNIRTDYKKAQAYIDKSKSKLDVMQQAIQAGGEAIRAVGAAFKAAGEIVAAFGDKGEKAQEWFEEANYLMEDIASVYDTISPIIGILTSIISLVGVLTAAGYSLQAAFFPILMITLALIALAGIVGFIINRFKKHDRDIDESIENIQKNISKLDHQLSILDWESSRLGDPFHKAAEQSELAYQKFLKACEAYDNAIQKKKRDDEEEQQLLETKTKEYQNMIDIFIGMRNEAAGSADDIASTLGNAFYDAFAQGENAARAWGDSVKEIMRDILRNAIINKYLLPQVNKLLDTTFGTGENGEGFDTSKLTDEGVMSNFQKNLMDIYNTFKDVNASLPKVLLDLLSGTADSSLSSNIQNVTEETASIIASYMNGIRHTIDIQSTLVRDISESVVQMRDYFPTIQTELVMISNNTGNTARATQELCDLINKMKTGSASLMVRMA